MSTMLRVVAQAKRHFAYLLRLRGGASPRARIFERLTAAIEGGIIMQLGHDQNVVSLRDTFVIIFGHARHALLLSLSRFDSAFTVVQIVKTLAAFIISPQM